MDPNLLGLPENLLYTVFEYSGFRSILTLRKVCHDFRNFIDDKLPNIGLKSISIMLSPEKLSIYYDTHQQSNVLEYSKHKIGCLVRHNNMDYLLVNQEYENLFFKELGLFLKHQKSALEFFRIAHSDDIEHSYMGDEEEEYQDFFSPLLEKIQDILKSKNNLLKVKSINLNAFRPAHVLAILPFIDPICLNEITISPPNSRESEDIFEVEELVKLNQWKSAEALHILHFTLSPDIKDFLHFTTVSVSLHTVSKEVLELLKEKMLCDSSMLEKFEIEKYKRFDDEEEYLKSMEQYGTDETYGGNRKWKIEMPKHKKRLYVSYVPEQQRITFHSWDF